jgi:hypothetical protein
MRCNSVERILGPAPLFSALVMVPGFLLKFEFPEFSALSSRIFIGDALVRIEIQFPSLTKEPYYHQLNSS